MAAPMPRCSFQHTPQASLFLPGIGTEGLLANVCKFRFQQGCEQIERVSLFACMVAYMARVRAGLRTYLPAYWRT